MAKRRNLYEEIRDGLEAYRDRRDTLQRHELVGPAAVMLGKDLRKRLRKGRPTTTITMKFPPMFSNR